jgi:hypothetical protein
MGWQAEGWSVSVTLDAHAGEKEKAHEALWRELQIRLGELVSDPLYAEIVLNLPDPIEYDDCDQEEDDSGYDLPCVLPRGHSGLHEAVITWP